MLWDSSCVLQELDANLRIKKAHVIRLGRKSVREMEIVSLCLHFKCSEVKRRWWPAGKHNKKGSTFLIMEQLLILIFTKKFWGFDRVHS
jgi:hypothetical protein